MYKMVGADGRQYGPVTVEQIQRWIAEGRVNSQTMVQAEGSDEWKLISSYPDLASALSSYAIPPRMPPPSGAQRAVPSSDGTLGGLIPYKNVYALVSYYLGVFSLIPCIGILLGIAAVIVGILGLRFATKHPEAKGVVHAWIGIIVGVLVVVLHLIVIVLLSNYEKGRL